MNDPFAVHGIEHLSPSTANLFEASPAAFVLNKVLKRPGKVGSAAYRGTAVEAGLTHGLCYGVSPKECVEVAEKEFFRLNALSTDPRGEKEKAAIPDFVKSGLAELLPYGKPSSTQIKIEKRFDEIAVPFIGFYDFLFKDKIVVDLKTTWALPNKISTKHARQLALYVSSIEGATEGRVTYVTPKKSATYVVDEIPAHLEALKRIGMTIQKFLSISSDPMELASHVVPDVSSFYFNDDEARQTAFEIWGI